MSIKEKLYSVPDRLVPVPIPEWDDEPVYVRLWSLAEKQKWAFQMQKTHNTEAAATKALVDVIVANVCNEDGSLMFTEQDRKQLADGPHGKAVERMFAAVCKANQVDDLDAAKKN